MSAAQPNTEKKAEVEAGSTNVRPWVHEGQGATPPNNVGQENGTTTANLTEDEEKDSVAYPKGIPFYMIMLGLFLTVFLMALDQVCLSDYSLKTAD